MHLYSQSMGLQSPPEVIQAPLKHELFCQFLHTEVNKEMFLLDPRECICITCMDLWGGDPHTYRQVSSK